MTQRDPIEGLRTFISLEALLNSTAPEDQYRKNLINGILDGSIEAKLEPMTMNFVEQISPTKVRFQYVVGPQKGSTDYTNWYGKRNTWEDALPLLEALGEICDSGVGRTLHIAVALTNENGKNFRTPLCLIDTRDTDIDGAESFSKSNLSSSQVRTQVDGELRKVNDPKKYLEFAKKQNRIWLTRTGFDWTEPTMVKEMMDTAEAISTESPAPKAGEMIDIGKIVGGETRPYWVAYPTYVEIAPGVMVSSKFFDKK